MFFKYLLEYTRPFLQLYEVFISLVQGPFWSLRIRIHSVTNMFVNFSYIFQGSQCGKFKSSWLLNLKTHISCDHDLSRSCWIIVVGKSWSSWMWPRSAKCDYGWGQRLKRSQLYTWNLNLSKAIDLSGSVNGESHRLVAELVRPDSLHFRHFRSSFKLHIPFATTCMALIRKKKNTGRRHLTYF